MVKYSQKTKIIISNNLFSIVFNIAKEKKTREQM